MARRASDGPNMEQNKVPQHRPSPSTKPNGPLQRETSTKVKEKYMLSLRRLLTTRDSRLLCCQSGIHESRSTMRDFQQLRIDPAATVTSVTTAKTHSGAMPSPLSPLKSLTVGLLNVSTFFLEFTPTLATHDAKLRLTLSVSVSFPMQPRLRPIHNYE